MSRSRAAIFISGRGSNMEALIRAAQDSSYSADIITVVSNRPDAPGLRLAQTSGLETSVIDHSAFTTQEQFERALHEHCTGRNIELIACAGFMRVLTAGFIERWQGRIINIHPSLLPAYRGLRTHERALQDGVRIHGCTVHFMTADLDAGPIIAQAAVPVFPEDTVEILAARVLKEEHRIYPMVLNWLASGLVTLHKGQVIYSFDVARSYASLLAPSPARR
jgi:phosphoribosylglycinamide formyltransferase-1